MAPQTWIQRLKEKIPALKEVPFLNNSPPFDWKLFSQNLAHEFGIDEIHIHPFSQKIEDSHLIEEGLGEALFKTAIELTPLGTAFWIMSREDMSKLTSWLLKPTSKTRAISSEILQEGFYRYLILESLNILQESEPFSDITLHLNERDEEYEKSYCIDLEIHFNGKSAWGRLVIPNKLQEAWINHFSVPSEYISENLQHAIELVTSIETGSTQLKESEWNEIKVGDFLLLDRGSFDPKHNAGIAKITLKTDLHSTPLFQTTIGDNKIEIIDYATIDEVFSENASDANEKTVQVVIEIATLKLSLHKLMNISPGDALDFLIQQDQEVSLILNGKTVGRGESLYLGEKLGVRITHLNAPPKPKRRKTA